MQYNYWDLGQQTAGTGVRVTLQGTEANVKLVDAYNYRAYSSGQRHEYFGGHYNRSPVVLQVPSDGHWFVTIDYGGRAGSGKAAVQVFPN
ncbi:DUF1883 domain-containing protein [Mycolicibacterium sp. HS_4_1]